VEIPASHPMTNLGPISRRSGGACTGGRMACQQNLAGPCPPGKITSSRGFQPANANRKDSLPSSSAIPNGGAMMLFN
jgi:hypothetical protein